MRHLNYNHLHYFWTVACEGSIARAAETLHLTPQTISGQLKLLEGVIGSPLFQRAGRGLVLTETGRMVKQYADEIFTVGAELSQRVRSNQPQASPVLTVGIVNSIAKLISYRVLEPALSSGAQKVRIVAREADLETLLAELALHRLDLVISDRPVPVGLGVKAYNHHLGESVIAFFTGKRLAGDFQRDFPRCLDGAPMLLPTQTTALRRELDDWFERVDVRPQLVAECDDSALMKVFGEAGAGVFPAPLAIAAEVERMYHASLIGQADEVRESYIAISPERRLKHPAVLDLIDQARSQLFQ